MAEPCINKSCLRKGWGAGGGGSREHRKERKGKTTLLNVMKEKLMVNLSFALV